MPYPYLSFNPAQMAMPSTYGQMGQQFFNQGFPGLFQPNNFVQFRPVIRQNQNNYLPVNTWGGMVARMNARADMSLYGYNNVDFNPIVIQEQTNHMPLRNVGGLNSSISSGAVLRNGYF